MPELGIDPLDPDFIKKQHDEKVEEKEIIKHKKEDGSYLVREIYKERSDIIKYKYEKRIKEEAYLKL